MYYTIKEDCILIFVTFLCSAAIQYIIVSLREFVCPVGVQSGSQFQQPIRDLFFTLNCRDVVSDLAMKG